MAYSSEEISIIHQQAIADPESIYSSLDGLSYIGTLDGRLRLINPETIGLNNVVEQLETNIAIIETPTIVPVVETSYFAIDSLGDLTPLPVIPAILTTNLFTLDLSTGDLSPNIIEGVNDIFFEIDVDNALTPKLL
jgi:hypothetical protein